MHYHNHSSTVCLYIFKQFLEIGAFGDLLTSCASFIIFVKNRFGKSANFCCINDGSLLCVNTVIVLLHLARTSYVSSNNDVCRIQRIITSSLKSEPTSKITKTKNERKICRL